MEKFCNFVFKVFLLLVLVTAWRGEAKADTDGRVRIGVAIFAEEKVNGMRDNDARLIASSLTTALMRLPPHIEIYERHQFDSIIREQGTTGASRMFDEGTLVDLGRLAGVQYVLIASVTYLGTERSSYTDNRGRTTYTDRTKVEVGIRMLDVATGRVRLAFSRTDSASGSAGSTGLRTQAIRDAMERDGFFGSGTRLVKTVRDALEKAFPVPRTPSVADTLIDNLRSEVGPGTPQSPTPTAPSSPAHTEFENKSTDPNVVIQKYPLGRGEKNTLRITHINAKKLRGQQAYDKYVELAESYSGDYLAAYEAGEAARRLLKFDDARTWYERALSINPNYEPAQRARAQMQ